MCRYVTYGIQKADFSAEKFYKTKHVLPCKPDYGLWASRIDAEYGWKEWCEDSDFRECSDSCKMEFELAANTKILEIHCEEDVLPYIVKGRYNMSFGQSKTNISDGINFEKLKSEGFDGLELFILEDRRLYDGVFNAWDCDSITIWNYDVIQPI